MKVVINFKGCDQWAEYIDGLWVVHCPEWEAPLLTDELLSTMTLRVPELEKIEAEVGDRLKFAFVAIDSIIYGRGTQKDADSYLGWLNRERSGVDSFKLLNILDLESKTEVIEICDELARVEIGKRVIASEYGGMTGVVVDSAKNEMGTWFCVDWDSNSVSWVKGCNLTVIEFDVEIA